MKPLYQTAAAVDAQHPGRVDRQLLDELRPAQVARLDQRPDADRQQRLQADDPVRSVRQFASFLLRSMRGMVGSNDFDGAVFQAGDDRCDG